MPVEKYIVKINRPENFTVSEMKAYISESVSTMSGSFYPEHPLFGNTRNVTVVKEAK